MTAWSRDFLEKLKVPFPVKKFPEFYGSRIFMTALYNSLPLVPILSQINPVH